MQVQDSRFDASFGSKKKNRNSVVLGLYISDVKFENGRSMRPNG